MIADNSYFFDDFDTVVLFGYSEAFKEIETINKKLGLKTIFITSKDQSKNFKKLDLKCHIFNKYNSLLINFLKKKVNFNKTLFICYGSRVIFKQEIINQFPNSIINWHNARLPLDRGGAALTFSILREERIYAQTVHLLTSKIDEGKIIKQYLSIYPKSASIPAHLMKHALSETKKNYKDFISKLKSKFKFALFLQPDQISRYNPRLSTEEDGMIDWSLDSRDLINFINAFDEPYKGASTYLNNGNFGKLYLKDVQLQGGDTSNHPFMSGIVSRHDGKWILVCTRNKHMLIVEKVLNNKGQNIIKQIKPGDRFYTPSGSLLDKRKKRVFYDSYGKK